MDLLLVALAGCMGMDIVSILKKKGGKIKDFEMVLSGEKNPEHPRRYLKIRYEIRCEGDYKREDLLRAFELSWDRYCSVLATLKNPPEFEFNILSNCQIFQHKRSSALILNYWSLEKSNTC